jgi:hypothetical protein
MSTTLGTGGEGDWPGTPIQKGILRLRLSDNVKLSVVRRAHAARGRVWRGLFHSHLLMWKWDGLWFNFEMKPAGDGRVRLRPFTKSIPTFALQAPMQHSAMRIHSCGDVAIAGRTKSKHWDDRAQAT